jgi:hypothetical protein
MPRSSFFGGLVWRLAHASKSTRRGAGCQAVAKNTSAPSRVHVLGILEEGPHNITDIAN